VEKADWDSARVYILKSHEFMLSKSAFYQFMCSLGIKSMTRQRLCSTVTVMLWSHTYCILKCEIHSLGKSNLKRYFRHHTHTTPRQCICKRAECEPHYSETRLKETDISIFSKVGNFTHAVISLLLKW